jgi:hypothetical protein
MAEWLGLEHGQSIKELQLVQGPVSMVRTHLCLVKLCECSASDFCLSSLSALPHFPPAYSQFHSSFLLSARLSAGPPRICDVVHERLPLYVRNRVTASPLAIQHPRWRSYTPASVPALLLPFCITAQVVPCELYNHHLT